MGDTYCSSNAIQPERARSDIGVLPLFGDRTPFMLAVSEAGGREAMFHPNGPWVAYTSDETGRDEVYVTSFPHPGGLRQISTAGGEYPIGGATVRSFFTCRLTSS